MNFYTEIYIGTHKFKKLGKIGWFEGRSVDFESFSHLIIRSLQPNSSKEFYSQTSYLYAVVYGGTHPVAFKAISSSIVLRITLGCQWNNILTNQWTIRIHPSFKSDDKSLLRQGKSQVPSVRKSFKHSGYVRSVCTIQVYKKTMNIK